MKRIDLSANDDTDIVDTAYAIANMVDCRRYNIEDDSAVWGQMWVKEKFRLERPRRFGLLVSSNEGIFFERYTAIAQRHLFENLIIGPNPEYPLYVRNSRETLEKLNLQNASLDHVSCPRGIHFLQEPLLRHLFSQIDMGLKSGAVVAFSFALFFNLNPDAIKVFKESVFLKEHNSIVPNPEDIITIRKIKQFAPGLDLASGKGKELASLSKTDLEKKIFKEKKSIIRHKYEDLFFKSNYGWNAFQKVKDARNVIITNAAILLQKSI